jgi:glycosyltransferase involved in cell wall biosynthesis
MKISIITPSFNQGYFIEKCIKSVQCQDVDSFEHIIIDGKSTDRTLEVLKKNKHSNLIWISESDKGQTDALNKGILRATGDIIGWINSDDYYEKNIFSNVVQNFSNNKIMWIIGNIAFSFPEHSNCEYKVSPTITYERLISSPDIVRQQGVFFRRSVFDEVGLFDTNKFMVMDYDFWVRLSKVYTPKMIDMNYAFFTWHSDQKSSAKNTIVQIKEIDGILYKNNARYSTRLQSAIKKIFFLIKSKIKLTLIKLGFVDKKYCNIPLSIKDNK